mmetsp:Transcript_15693/g.37855  ORF Transcript_15693/g.37855 Transcript_15693/m.37855 type:complete len:250 (-) Transcript_15693:409-1158(-)
MALSGACSEVQVVPSAALRRQTKIHRPLGMEERIASVATLIVLRAEQRKLDTPPLKLRIVGLDAVPGRQHVCRRNGEARAAGPLVHSFANKIHPILVRPIQRLRHLRSLEASIAAVALLHGKSNLEQRLFASLLVLPDVPGQERSLNAGHFVHLPPRFAIETFVGARSPGVLLSIDGRHHTGMLLLFHSAVVLLGPCLLLGNQLRCEREKTFSAVHLPFPVVAPPRSALDLAIPSHLRAVAMRLIAAIV